MARPPTLSGLAVRVANPAAFHQGAEIVRAALLQKAQDVGQTLALGPRASAETRFAIACGALLAAGGLWNEAITRSASNPRTRAAFQKAAAQAFDDMAARAARAGLGRPETDGA